MSWCFNCENDNGKKYAGYCSDKCKIEFKKESMEKIRQEKKLQEETNEFFYSLSKAVRKFNRIYKLNQKQCFICGFQTVVHLHHIDKNRQNNSFENLIPLCPNHHYSIHTAKIPLSELLITPLLINYTVAKHKNRPLEEMSVEYDK